MKARPLVLTTCAALVLSAAALSATATFQGFELDTADRAGSVASSDLRGRGHVGTGLWPNGFADAPLGSDSQSTGSDGICGWPFSDVRRGENISCGPDLGGTGQDAWNLSGSAKSTGDTWITLWGPAGLGPTGGLGGFVGLDADVLIRPFNNKKGAGLLALFNAGTGKGLALVIYDNGNTDTLVLGTVDSTTGRFSALKIVPLGARIAENAWYHLSMGVEVIGTNLAVEGIVSRHKNPTNPDPSGDLVAVGTLSFNAPLPAGVEASGEVGIVGSAFSAALDSSVTNFFIAIP